MEQTYSDIVIFWLPASGYQLPASGGEVPLPSRAKSLERDGASRLLASGCLLLTLTSGSLLLATYFRLLTSGYFATDWQMVQL
jgi:hypothetical protein